MSEQLETMQPDKALQALTSFLEQASRSEPVTYDFCRSLLRPSNGISVPAAMAALISNEAYPGHTATQTTHDNRSLQAELVQDIEFPTVNVTTAVRLCKAGPRNFTSLTLGLRHERKDQAITRGRWLVHGVYRPNYSPASTDPGANRNMQEFLRITRRVTEQFIGLLQ
jgi:hypothetical protein